MAYEPQSFAGFGAGLNLRDHADTVAEDQAIDLRNVVFTERGAVKQRAGVTDFITSLTNQVTSLHPYYKTDGTRQLLAGAGTRLEAIATGGTIVASATGLTSGTWDFTRFGSPGAELAYAGNGKNLLRKWDGANWSSVANSPKARYLEVMAVDKGNRMVAAGFDDSSTSGPSASQAYTSRVWFSNAGDPETWGANNYVDLTPGDGESIQNVLAWREYVVVFKETKFFVFTGTDTDSAGNPVFRYYTVDTGVGLASPRAVTASSSAIYFMARDGLYRTTGGDPELISGLVAPLWTGEISDYYTGGVIDHANITNCVLHHHVDGRLYLGFTTASSNDRVLVYDTNYDWWSLWSGVPAVCFASFRVSNQAELISSAANQNSLFRHGPAYTSDDGTAIESFWRSGWFDYGLPIVKTIRESKVWGTGRVYLSISTDFYVGTGTVDLLDMVDTGATTWGGTTWGGALWGATAGRKVALRRRATRGTVFSTYLSNTTLDQEWTVARLDHHLRESRIPSVKTGAGI